MEMNYDYNSAFKGISVKLKKRFLRKPNVSEAIEEYMSLARQLENEECYNLSGYCMQQISKSYHSVGNTILESSYLQQAAKQYLNSEISSRIELGAITLDEDLINAISLYDEAIKLHCEQNERKLAAKLCSELADILALKFERYFEAMSYYERAISLFQPVSSLNQLKCETSSSFYVISIQFRLATLKVYTCDYSGALDLFSEICNSILGKCIYQSSNLKEGEHLKSQSNILYNKPIGVYAKWLIESEVSKLLLLLCLNPTKLKLEHSNTLEEYSWLQTSNNYLPIECMDSDFFILLQSFVMACKSNDSKLIYTLQSEISTYFNYVQNYLLNLIVDQLLHSSYTDDLLSN
jgi:factor VIII intron 22 protein